MRCLEDKQLRVIASVLGLSTSKHCEAYPVWSLGLEIPIPIFIYRFYLITIAFRSVSYPKRLILICHTATSGLATVLSLLT